MSVMMTILSAFAVYRISHLFKYDEGPFHVFENARLVLGRRASYSPTAKFLADIVNCCYCSTVWIAIPFAFFVLFPRKLTNIFVVWLGLAGASELLHIHSDMDD